MSTLTGCLRLLRWPGALTAAANAVTGFLLVRRAGGDGTRLAAAAIASSAVLVYLGGVVLNDACDAERDRALHPGRPIPAGDVTRATAIALGLGLLVAGPLVALAMAGPAAGVAMGAAALCALLYDIGGKRWRVPGSLLMGGARASNAAAGMLASALTVEVALGAPSPGALAYPIAVGGYTVLLTYASTFEERRPTAVLAGGLALILILPAALAWPLFAARWWWAPALPLFALAATLVSGARDAQIPDGPGLGALIRRAVFGFLLVDAAWLMGATWYDAGFWLILVYVGLRFLLARLRS